MLGIDFGIKEIVDILLVATLMYQAFTLLHRSGASSVFWGVMTVLVAWFVSSYVFHLELTGAIFDKIINVGAIALIVLFQDELRSYMSHVGKRLGRFSFGFQRLNAAQTDVIREELAMAIMHMAESKTGALIILAGKDPLEAYTETGETLDATISARLVENIFFKNTPLHDGALFIRSGRIVCAAAILPVSKRTDIPNRYGLRHRAALGLTEHCDATAIVVSEETGRISIVKDGDITPIRREDIREYLNI